MGYGNERRPALSKREREFMGIVSEVKFGILVVKFGERQVGTRELIQGELIQREMGRRILRCRGNTTTEAVLGELGWWKLQTRREYAKLKYWVGILLMEETRLVKQVYNQSRIEFVTRNKSNWVKIIYQLTHKYGLQRIWNNEQIVRQGQEGKTEAQIKHLGQPNL